MKKGIMIVLMCLLCVTSVKANTLQGVMRNNTTMVPVRSVGVAFGATVKYDDKTQTVTLTYKEDVITLTIGSTKASINVETKTLLVAPDKVGGPTYIPFRSIGEAVEPHATYASSTMYSCMV